MKRLEEKSSPFLHDFETTVNLQIDLLVGLLAVMVIAIVQNGLRVLAICAVSAFVSWATETLGLLIMRKPNENYIRSISTGILIALLCPVTVSIWLPASASFFSVLIFSVILGSTEYGRLFTVPSIAWIFMLSVAPRAMTVYPVISDFSFFPIFDNINSYHSTRSIAQLLQANSTPPYTFSNLLTGNYPGGMGTTCIFVILAVCIYFIFRKSMAWQVSLSMILTVTAFALVFNRTGSSVIFSVLYELTATSYIYIAVFVAGDIINAPMLTAAKVLYGVVIGVITMLCRYIGLGEHCVVIALLICNFISEFFDLVALKFQINRTKKLFFKV